MAINITDSIRVGQQKPVDDKYFNGLAPYTSITQVNNLIPKAVRHIGLTVNINGEEYWYKDGIEDYDLIFKSNHKTIEVTREELYNNLIPNEKLEPGRLYKITGIESWSFSQHLINCIYLKALTNTSLETTGFGEFYNVDYGYAPVWAGNLLEAGLIDSLEYNIDEYVIWGNLLWKNISGQVGTNLKNFGEDWGDISLPNYLSESDWLPITPQESSNHYNISIDVIKYDIENDYISYREDTLGNKYEQSFSNLVRNYPNYGIVDSDESYRYYVGGISLFHWGEPDTVYGNTIKDSLVLNCNNSSQLLLDSSFYNNNFENSLFYENLIISNSIRNNKFLNSGFYYNHLKGSSVESNEYNKSYSSSNILDSVVFGNNILLNQSNFENNIFKYISVSFNSLNSSYIVNNNLKSPNQGSSVRLYKNTLYDSSIQSNMYYIDIAFNILNRGSLIANNTDNEITVYNRISTITKNNLDNNSTINSNDFVEEGKGISGYSKGINDNILNNTCNINSNIVKNGSRIFGHTLEYYSTINGNTLDIDSNIYNNQLIQNGKINNNILTGHGGIYGNQLDLTSEITLCKLRISPATSYSTTMKGNRLFNGRIQNIDFGDIINPEGTNPNNPAFGGNFLSECIIENSSVIKDLTFPNTGGKGLQFIKMNGYSEFKNITVNDLIRNVDFINTIFNETSDYSKLIEGNGYQTNGFTKTYIDGVLLKDSLNTKLDKGAYTGNASDLKSLIDTKADLEGGKIPATQLPSYVDDVLEYENLASFPSTGESSKIYIALDTNLTYRWGGSSYVGISSSLALGETSSTAYRGDRGKIAYDHSQVTTGNPHGTTKNDIGLENVDNTSDLNKPISTATQTALNLKENVSNKATDLSNPNNTKYPTTLAVANENKKATITIELISNLTTIFYAPNSLRINSTALISGSGSLTLKVNDVAYTLGNVIPQGAKITAETTSSSVYNLISIYE